MFGMSLGHRVKLGLLMSAALLAAWIVSFGAAPNASANQAFCSGVSLAPYGQGGDRCWGPSANGLDMGWVITVQRAGCVTIADGSNNLLTSWVCGPAGSSPGLAASVFLASAPGVWRKAVIRNNNLSNSGNFSGIYGCNSALC